MKRGLALLAAVGAVSGCGGHQAATWPLPNADLSGTRAAPGSAIDAGNVARLRVLWRFHLPGKPGSAGMFSSTPLITADSVYVQDLASDVFALDPGTGRTRWAHRFNAPNGGPNGLALANGRLFGATDADAFALDAAHGTLLWSRHLTSRDEQLVDVAPLPWHGLVFVSTIGYPPYGRGAIYALDAASGAVRWKFTTIARPWTHPVLSGGGGTWYPVSVDADGRLYAGNSNPSPWGGSPALPNGAAFPGPVLYTDSLIVLDARTGRLDWFDQVTRHDVRDQDFEATPILAHVNGKDVVFGAGKAGRVIAWDRGARKRLWETPVGIHRNDVGPLPDRRVTVCPGLLGGVETPMAYADGRLFVPVVDLCGWGSATSRQRVVTVRPEAGRGRIVALDGSTGRVAWQRRLGSPAFGCATVANDVVFTSTYAGTLLALAARDGAVLWRTSLPAGINACPAAAGTLLLIGAGVPLDSASSPQLVAYGIR